MAGRLAQFGQYLVPLQEVFYYSKFCMGLVNLKPVVQGTLLWPSHVFSDLWFQDVRGVIFGRRAGLICFRRTGDSTPTCAAIWRLVCR